MLDVFGFPTPQGANYQEFYGGANSGRAVRDWIKPRGASMVRMLLIGPGGGGSVNASGGGGGGSGAVTQWIGPAIFIPDVLRVSVGRGGAGAVSGNGSTGVDTTIIYQQKDGTGYTLLTASAGFGAINNSGGTAASANTNNFFGAAGIFRSVGGQAGASGGNSITANTGGFLSGGGGGASVSGGTGGDVAANYGYPTILGGAAIVGGNGANGFFITQPILLSVGGAGGGGSNTAGGAGGKGGIGSGGGGGGVGLGGNGPGGDGGDGAVFIWSW